MTDFRILGPLEVAVGGQPLSLAGARQRALLAILLLHAGETVSTDRLIDELWGDDPPEAGSAALRVRISQLRRVLGAAGELLVTRTPGYAMALAPDQLDLRRFERLVAAGDRALRQRDPAQAVKSLREALALWRGPPLADFSYAPFAQPAIVRLEELRVAAIELHVEAQLALGDHARLIGELQALVLEHPLRERLCGQLMLALYRDGRQAEALAAYRAARRRLVDEIGVEPGPGLHDLEGRILAQDDGLVRELHDDLLKHAPGFVSVVAPPATRLARRVDPLPPPPNRTIGRAREVGALGARLRSGQVRLLTLTGPGGVGKTRLAIESARTVEADFADGACFVSFASLLRSEDVPAAILDALGIVLLSGESATQALERFLAAKQVLLVVDNLEHLPAAGSFIGGLLRACPALTVLATSREPLTLQAEERCPVLPLALPGPDAGEDPDAFARVDAVALFCERARAHDPGFHLGDGNADYVAEICRRVDGLPLALELAAARCGLLSPAEIAERLDAALSTPGVGVRDSPPRQQTLRATIDWSHDLLSRPEQACFARCAVFAGGATVDAAETLTGASLDTLEHLVAKSLLVRRRRGDAPTRLSMLETIRAYATKRFAAAADAERVRERHYDYFLATARRDGADRALCGPGGKEHLARLNAENDNLAAALGWAIGRGDAGRALAMVGALCGYWLMRERYAEATAWIDQALSLPGADADPALRVPALRTKTRCLWQMGRASEQPAILAALQAIAQRLGDPVIHSQVLQLRVDRAMDTERLDVADALADEALDWARAAGDEWEIAEASRGKAIAASSIADLRERVARAASLLSDVGNVHQLANLLTAAAYAALCLGSERDATDFAARAAPIARALESRFVRMINSGNLGLAALLSGETDAASHAFCEELRLCREMVVRPVVFEGLRGQAAIAVLAGDATRAATLVGAAEAHRYDAAPDPVEARLDKTFFEPARTECGTDAWDAAVREGSVLSFEQAIAYALKEPRG